MPVAVGATISAQPPMWCISESMGVGGETPNECSLRYIHRAWLENKGARAVSSGHRRQVFLVSAP